MSYADDDWILPDSLLLGIGIPEELAGELESRKECEHVWKRESVRGVILF